MCNSTLNCKIFTFLKKYAIFKLNSYEGIIMFDKNMQFLQNENLKNKLLNMNLKNSSVDLSYCMTTSNDYLLMKNDFPLDDLNNPREAIRSMLEETIKHEMAPNDIIITFGIGLCYLLDETYNRYPSKIIVYEPDINLLHFVLNNVDISEHLASGRVYISSSLDEVVRYVNSIYITKDKVEIVYLKNYAIIKNKELLELSQKIYEACNSKMIDINTIKKYSKKWLENTIKNIYQINHKDVYKLSDLNGKFTGQTALIISAGPSLLDNIEEIKANRSKYVIFAINKVLKTLAEHGIKPDFVVTLDAQNINLTYKGIEDFCRQTNCITEIKSDTISLEFPFKKTFIGFSTNDFVTKKIAEFDKNIELNNFGGTSTTMALISAIKMGFSKIIFIGLDMAFRDNTIYSTGEILKKTSENKAIIHNAEKKIVKVAAVGGGMVETRDDYASAIYHLETIIQDTGYSEIYNITSFGAEIKGMKYLPFKNISLLVPSIATSIIVGDIEPFKLKLDAWAQNELNIINEIMLLLSSSGYSQMLISKITKSSLMYQYMQADILEALQTKFAESYAEQFISNTKLAIKNIIEMLQKYILV